MLVVAGLAEGSAVLRVVFVQTGFAEFACRQRVVVCDAGRHEALRPVAVGLIGADAQRVALEDVGSEAELVGPPVAAVCRRAPTLFCLCLASRTASALGQVWAA